MITCGQLRCILATSAACRAILGMGHYRKGEGGRGRVGFRPRSSPPCFIPLPMVIFHPLPLPCGPSPGEDHFVFGSSLLCFFASAAHLATGFRSAVFPLSCHLPRMGISFIFLFFSWLPLFFCAILEVVWRVIQPTADVGRCVFSFWMWGRPRKGYFNYFLWANLCQQSRGPWLFSVETIETEIRLGQSGGMCPDPCLPLKFSWWWLA